jgi:hypothetical protein
MQTCSLGVLANEAFRVVRHSRRIRASTGRETRDRLGRVPVISNVAQAIGTNVAKGTVGVDVLIDGTDCASVGLVCVCGLHRAQGCSGAPEFRSRLT